MFFPGLPPAPRGLLTRHLPALAEGIAAEYAARYSRPGDLVFDPFGQSPQLALEAALTGRRVLVANPNPVARFALRLALDPIPETTLRAALTLLADQPKDDERLEGHLQSLYRTTCPDCGSAASVDFFEWDKERGEPVAKTYFCQTEEALLTRPTEASDVEAALAFRPRSLSYSWALEQAAPHGEPAREDAAEVLAAYTPRALHALVLILRKLEALGPLPEQRRAVEALLLAAFDECASVWPPVPDPRGRPRTVHPPARYREFNPWRALENAVGNLPGAGVAVEVCGLTEIAEAGGPRVCLFEGTAREAARQLPPGSASLALTVVPRPSPALWGLCAVWSAWLWGEAASAPLKTALAHKRSDFDWHEQGLRRAFKAVRPALATEARLVGLLPEAEEGALEAALMAADTAGFTLSPADSGFRSDPPEAQLVFQPDAPTPRKASAAAPPRPHRVAEAIGREAIQAGRALLLARGEAARWASLHPAAWMHAANQRRLRQAAAADERPLSLAGDAIRKAYKESPAFVRLGAEPEAELSDGHWWLREAASASEPMADRAERSALRALAGGHPVEEGDIEAAVCREASTEPGGQAPDRHLFRACLASYAEDLGEGLWQLRAGEAPAARAADREEICELLAQLGQRLGYTADRSGEGRVDWHESQQMVYAFCVQATATLGEALGQALPNGARGFVVLPGSRAGLAAFKLGRDPHLAALAETGGWGFLKFRHARRMAVDTGLDRAAFAATLELDPVVEKAAAQLPLL